MERAVLTLVGTSFALDPHGAHTDDLVNACNASHGFIQDLARQCGVVDDMQH